MEQWKKISKFPTFEASTLGNIRSTRTHYTSTYKGKTVRRTIPESSRVGEKLNKKGYKRINFGKITELVHRVIAETFIENPLQLPQVNHINGIKTDNRVENLEWVTNQQNRDHAVKNNLIAVRDKGLGKLTTTEVTDALNEYRTTNQTQKQIAAKYNICQQTISILWIKSRLKKTLT